MDRKTGLFFSKPSNIVGEEHLWKNIIILENWNAQIGKNSLTDEYIKIVGNKLGFDICNENGEEFIMFLHINKLYNISTKIGTNWWSGERKSQIDHVVKAVESKINIRFIKGYKTKIETDHKLLIAAIKGNDTKGQVKKKSRARTVCSCVKDRKCEGKIPYRIKTNKHK